MIFDKKVIVIIALALVIIGLSFFLKRKPKEVIKIDTVTKVEVQTKILTVEKLVNNNIVTNRTIDEVKPDGTKQHIVETVADTSKTQSDTKVSQSDTITSKEVSKTIEKYSSDYILGLNYQQTILNPSLSPKLSDFTFLAGQRMFGSPVFLTGSISGNLKTASIGILIEL